MPRPFFTPSNQLYNEMDGESFHLLMGALKTIATVLKVNEEDSHALLSDDMLIWFRNLGFLKDERFKKACEGFESSAFIRAKLYRVYNYCWAARYALDVDGVAVDLGTYDAKTVQIADRYTKHKHDWRLFDAFDHHPAIENKGKHASKLVEEVKERVPTAKIFPGLLPDTIDINEEIAFIHVDLNDGAAEVACLELLYDQIAKGGIILLDDYGWLRFRESQKKHDAFFKSKGKSVLEMPTGVGMVIKT